MVFIVPHSPDIRRDRGSAPLKFNCTASDYPGHNCAGPLVHGAVRRTFYSMPVYVIKTFMKQCKASLFCLGLFIHILMVVYNPLSRCYDLLVGLDSSFENCGQVLLEQPVYPGINK